MMNRQVKALLIAIGVLCLSPSSPASATQKLYPPYWYPCLGCVPCGDSYCDDDKRHTLTQSRVFNDFSTSTLTITNDLPALATIDERNMTDDGMGGNFANRHDLLLSFDDGVTPFQFTTDIGFTLSAVFTLDAGAILPRKEAGIRINSSVTGDALFEINSNGAAGNTTGEIVGFGGGAPFYSFSDGVQPDYVLGKQILMGVNYSGDTSSPRTLQYFIDRFDGAGIISSPLLAWSNLENGPVDFTVGFFGQVSPANGSDFITVKIANMNFDTIPAGVPEPTSLMLSILGLVTLGVCTRYRKCLTP